MAVHIRDASNALRQVPVWRMRGAGGVALTIKEGKIRDSGNALRTFLAAPTGGAYPATMSEVQGVFDFPYTVTTQQQAQIIVLNMLSPITYSWTFGGGAPEITATAPDKELTRFVTTFNSAGTRIAGFTGKATDAAGRTVQGYIEVTMTTLDWD
jgi:hypothetical protein